MIFIIIFIISLFYLMINKLNKQYKPNFVDTLLKSLSNKFDENNKFDNILAEIFKKLQNNGDKRLKYIQEFKQYRNSFVKSISENLDDCKEYLKLLDELQNKNKTLSETNKRLNSLTNKMNIIIKENKLNVYEIMKNKKILLEESIKQLNYEIQVIKNKLQEIIKKLNIEEVEKIREKQNETLKQMGRLANDTGTKLENKVKNLIISKINDPTLKIIQNIKFHDKNKNLFAEFDLMIIKLDEKDPINNPVKILKVFEVKHNANNITESFYQHKKQLEIIANSDEIINGYVNKQIYKFSKKSFDDFEITKYLYFAVGYPDDFIIFPYPYSSKIVNYLISKFTTIPTIEEVYFKTLTNQKIILNQDFDINKLIEVKNFEKLDEISKQIINELLNSLIIETEQKLEDVLELYKKNDKSNHIIKISA